MPTVTAIPGQMPNREFPHAQPSYATLLAPLPPMNDLAPRPTLLEELDHRQDDVLQQLDDLNAQVESLIREFTGARPSE